MGSHSSKLPAINWSETPHIVNADNYKLFCYYWEPAQNPRALVFITHGLAEHCGWYDDFGKALAEQGVLSFAHDHVGHGKSEGCRCYIDKFEQYTQDVVQHATVMKERYPGIPCFIIGHSMGGLISVRTILDNPELFCGLAMIAPLLASNPETATPFKVKLAKMAASAFPKLGIGNMERGWMTRDEAINKAYEEDPLVYHGPIRAKPAVLLLGAVEDFKRRVTEIQVPIVNFHGTVDKLCELSGSRFLQEKASSTDKTLHVIEGALHAIHHEPEGVGEKCKKDLVDWIVNHV